MTTALATADTAAMAVELHDLVGKLKRRLREQATAADLPPSQMLVLRRLDRHGPATVSALARAAGMRSQSMGALVAALQAAGLVSGEPDPEDGRQTLWSVMPATRKWMKESRAVRQDWLQRRIETELAPREQQQLAQALALLQRVAQCDAAAEGTRAR